MSEPFQVKSASCTVHLSMVRDGPCCTVFASHDATASAGREEQSLPLRDDAALIGEGVPDMTSLSYLHEAAILYNLRTRFFATRPYT